MQAEIGVRDGQALGGAALVQLRHALATLPELAEIETLSAERAKLADQARDAQILVDDLTREQKKADQDVEQVKARRERDRTRMDQGLITNPKDLERMSHELESLEKRISDLEDVELEIHVTLAGQVVVCKLDAVYRVDDGVHDHQIVDWKTGKAPRDAEDLERKQLQLALYRLAYAKHTGIDPERIDAVFYFVADDVVVRPERLYTESELVALWSTVTRP